MEEINLEFLDKPFKSELKEVEDDTEDILEIENNQDLKFKYKPKF